MGITIHHKIAQEKKYIEKNIDELEAVAKLMKAEADKLSIGFEIRRLAPLKLFIDIDGCETLAFDFQTWAEMEKERAGWNGMRYMELEALFEKSHTGEHYERWPDQKLVWSIGFCKTQFGTSILSHKWVADLVRLMASRAVLAVVNDEADYYHNNDLGDAADSIASLGAMINGLGEAIAGKNGFEIVKGGETTIKSSKKK